MIAVSNLSKKYGEKTVLSSLSLTVPTGKTVGIMGASGCGKTTLLRIIAGLEKADAGSVYSDEKDDRLSVVFADARLFPSVSVLENVMCVSDESKREAEKKAREIMERLDIPEAEGKKPEELSTGMAQRVSLARALLYDAPVFLMDEPFRGLDEASRKNAVSYVAERLAGKTAVIITHNRDEAEALCDTVYKMENGTLTEE